MGYPRLVLTSQARGFDMAETLYFACLSCKLGSPPPLTSMLSACSKEFSANQDVIDGGNRQVTGTTKNTGTPNMPVRRLVRLFDGVSGRLVRAQWSNATTGEYRFERIRKGVFFVTSEDYTGQYNGVIATGINSEAMP